MDDSNHLLRQVSRSTENEIVKAEEAQQVHFPAVGCRSAVQERRQAILTAKSCNPSRALSRRSQRLIKVFKLPLFP